MDIKLKRMVFSAVTLIALMTAQSFGSEVFVGMARERPHDSAQLHVMIGRLISYKISRNPFDRIITVEDLKTKKRTPIFLAENATVGGIPFTCTGRDVAADPGPMGQLEAVKGWCAKWPSGRNDSPIIAVLYWQEVDFGSMYLTADAVATE